MSGDAADAAAAADGDYDYDGDDVGRLELRRLVDLSHSQAEERKREGEEREVGREGGS